MGRIWKHIEGTKSRHPRSEETKQKLRVANLGKKKSEETKRKLSIAGTGRILTEDSKQKIRLSMLGEGNHQRGKSLTSEWKKHLSENSSHYYLGKHLSEEARKKISISRTGNWGGDKNPAWLGGISFEPYSLDWTQTLKRSIRERDKYTCQICGSFQTDKEFCVHHIDYNKKNCNPTNLITLCRSCHGKTSANRKYWISYFNNLNKPQ